MKRLLSLFLICIIAFSCFTVSAEAPPIPETPALEVAEEYMTKEYIQSKLPKDTHITLDDLNHIRCQSFPTIHLDSRLPSIKQAFKNPSGYLFVVYANEKPAITIWTVQDYETGTFRVSHTHGDADDFVAQQSIFETVAEKEYVVLAWELGYFFYGKIGGQDTVFPASQRDSVKSIPNAEAYMKSRGKSELFILKHDFESAVALGKSDDRMGASVLYHLAAKPEITVPWWSCMGIGVLFFGIASGIYFLFHHKKRKSIVIPQVE